MRLLAQVGQFKSVGIKRVVFCTQVVFIFEQQVQRQAGQAGLDLVVQNEICIEEL